MDSNVMTTDAYATNADAHLTNTGAYLTNTGAYLTNTGALALARADATDPALRFVPVGVEAWDYCRALAKANMEPYLAKRGQRWTTSSWDDKAPSREFFELYVDRKRVGFVSLWRDNDVDGVHIGDIQLEADARNRGVGAQAIARVFAIARSRGLREVTLNVFRDNPAIRLYERMGFLIIDHGFDKLKMRYVL
jgi:ribosomal protein S18 acetylase RimI-like enzyme